MGLFSKIYHILGLSGTSSYAVFAQIHKYKYTNTAYDEVPERPKKWYIFEKRIVQGYQKLYSHVPNAKIQKYKYKIHKYANTAYDKVPERPKMWYIFEKRIVQ